MGDTSTHGTPARRARSTATSRAFQVGACSCCHDSSCSSSTTTAAEVTDRRPGRGPAAHDGGPGPGRAQSRGRIATARRPDAAAARGGGPRRPTGTAPARCPARPRPAPPVGSPAGGSRSTAPAANASASSSSGRGGSAAARPASAGPHRLVGRRGAQEVRRAPGPAPRRPLGQVDQVGRRPPAGDLGDRPQRRRRAVALDVVGHHPAADPTAVQVDADHGARRAPGPRALGDQVVEGLVDGRRIGQDPHDPLGAGTIDGSALGWRRPDAGGSRRGWEREGQSGTAQSPSAERRSSTLSVAPR